jgi:hypothetical protein
VSLQIAALPPPCFRQNSRLPHLPADEAFLQDRARYNQFPPIAAFTFFMGWFGPLDHPSRAPCFRFEPQSVENSVPITIICVGSAALFEGPGVSMRSSNLLPPVVAVDLDGHFAPLSEWFARRKGDEFLCASGSLLLCSRNIRFPQF